ncbi:MAG TPA: aminotransferase class III-fold pyridoxal phosphate-dependent enzyme, partial [Pseudodesulfovibrio sp.]|nr:aminotransferase class III-fold pyridoxal phosphate-dependent enzyme [Pseudodesulfovibrio sp.]
GHGEEDVTLAAMDQLALGQSFSLASDVEYRLAERLVNLIPGMEMVKFGKNGCDVTGAAVRLARAVTGRDHIVYNGYHGHHDWSMGMPPKNGGVPWAMQNLSHKTETQSLGCIGEYLAAFKPAALVMEPVVSADPIIHPESYWKEIRRICDDSGTLLVLDEIVTFGRVGFPGAISEWGIEADLWCGAKAMGNGWPITAILGKREVMKRIEEDVFYSTTFAGEAVSIAAALACLDILEAKGPPKRVGRAWADAVEALSEKYDLGMRVVGYDARPVLRDMPEGFLAAMIDEGVLCQGYLNATWAHEAVMDELVEATERACQRVTGKG